MSNAKQDYESWFYIITTIIIIIIIITTLLSKFWNDNVLYIIIMNYSESWIVE